MARCRISLKRYNDDVYVTVCYADDKGAVSGGGKRTHVDRTRVNSERGEMNIDDIKRSAKRAYVELKRRALAIRVDRMLTLTFAKNLGIESKAICDKIFAAFIKRCKRKFGTFEYVAVPELQKRGAIHYHLGLTRFYKVYELWELWKSSIIASGQAQSTSKIGSVFINKRAKQAKQGVAAYIAKYITKSIANIDKCATKFNGRRYYASHVDIERLQSFEANISYPCFDKSGSDLKRELSKRFDFFRNEQKYAIFNIFEVEKGVMSFHFCFFHLHLYRAKLFKYVPHGTFSLKDFSEKGAVSCHA